MPLQVWIDGTFYDKENAKVSVYDHGLLYGDGVFEGMRVYNGKLFEAEAHFQRLFHSARAIRLQIPYTADQLKSATDEAFRRNGFTECYVRLVVTRGVGSLGLGPDKCDRPTVIIITDTIAMYPREMYENGMPIITASVIRTHANALSPRIKSLNYLNNILAKIEANDAGVPEAVMMNSDGNVAECTGDNIFIVKAGVVYTPSPSDGILEGITRKVILELCTKLQIPAVETTIQRYDLYVAEEFFLTGSGAEVIPVTRIDGRAIADGKPGPITKRLIAAFHQHVRG